jgi:hypothetical protein
MIIQQERGIFGASPITLISLNQWDQSTPLTTESPHSPALQSDYGEVKNGKTKSLGSGVRVPTERRCFNDPQNGPFIDLYSPPWYYFS